MKELKNFHPAHIDLFQLEDQEKLDLLKENTKYFDEAKTILIDGKPVFAIGMLMIKDGVANCWIIRTKYMNEYKKTVVEITTKFLEDYAKEYKIIRWQTIIEDQHFINWIEFLGFERECELLSFDRDENKKSYLYRRLMICQH